MTNDTSAKHDVSNDDRNPNEDLKLAGCGLITEDEAEVIHGDVIEHCTYLVSDDFLVGYISGVLYSSVPKDADTYDKTPHEYVLNAYRGHKHSKDAGKRLFKALGI